MLKKILLTIPALIAAFLLVVALQPSAFRVERSQTIAASQAELFARVNDFHAWEEWSPWAKLDPAAKVSFEGAPAGEGAVFAWSGNDTVGEGKMTLIESKPNDAIKIRVDFVKPFEGTNMTEFVFKPADDRSEVPQTEVTWSMSAHHNFMEKAFCLIGNGKQRVGDGLDRGLARLKSVSEAGVAKQTP